MADYFVDGLVGNDANAGTSEGAGDAWKTIGKGASNPIAAGDRLFVKASAPYPESPDFSGISGAASTPIVLEGYSTTVGDGGRAVVTNDGAATAFETGARYSVRNFQITGGTTRGLHMSTLCIAENCEVDGSALGTNYGFEGFTGSYFVGCYAHDCDVRGFWFSAVSGAFSCIADTCVSGFRNNVKTFGYFYCIARNNTLHGITGNEMMVNCTVDNVTNSGNGILQGSNPDLGAIINCVMINCNVGAVMNASASTERNWSFNNCVFGNNSDYGGGGSTASGEITSDPTFVSEAAKNYGPDAGSPLIMAGYDSRIASWLSMTGDPIDVGALQSGAGGDNFAGAFLNWGVN